MREHRNRKERWGQAYASTRLFMWESERGKCESEEIASKFSSSVVDDEHEDEGKRWERSLRNFLSRTRQWVVVSCSLRLFSTHSFPFPANECIHYLGWNTGGPVRTGSHVTIDSTFKFQNAQPSAFSQVINGRLPLFPKTSLCPLSVSSLNFGTLGSLFDFSSFLLLFPSHFLLLLPSSFIQRAQCISFFQYIHHSFRSSPSPCLSSPRPRSTLKITLRWVNEEHEEKNIEHGWEIHENGSFFSSLSQHPLCLFKGSNSQSFI